jgi:hypothetical protein
VPPETDPAAYQRALDKYKELYIYSTDVLLKEHERFNRADEKASKYSTMFTFLIGAFAFFDKAVMDGMLPPNGIVEWAIIAIGVIGLLLTVRGWYTSNSVIKLHPYVSRRLDVPMIDFFRTQTLLNIYYGLAKENMSAYQENLVFAEHKHECLFQAAKLMKASVSILVLLAILYGIDRWVVALNNGPLI